jgi:hypothetical protein
MDPELPHDPDAHTGPAASNNKGYLIGWTIALIVFTAMFLWLAAK